MQLQFTKQTESGLVRERADEAGDQQSEAPAENDQRAQRRFKSEKPYLVDLHPTSCKHQDANETS